MNIRAKIFGGATTPEESVVVPAKKPKGAKADTLDSVSVAREEARRANTRADDRHRLPDEQVRVTHEGRNITVQLVNLSGGGAMVSGDLQPKLWDRLELHLGDDGNDANFRKVSKRRKSIRHGRSFNVLGGLAGIVPMPRGPASF